MDKQGKFKFIGSLILFTLILSLMVYAISTSLDSPIASFIDDDGYLDLKGRCTPTSGQNITNATLFSNVDGTWKANKTFEVDRTIGIGARVDVVYYANFTNYINQSSEGTFQWNILCTDNSTDADSFANNRTIIVEYANPTITAITPADGVYDLDGHGINSSCTVSPTSGWNTTTIELWTDIGGTWTLNNTISLATPTEQDYILNYTINSADNQSILDGTDVTWGCAAVQEKNFTAAGDTSIEVVTSTYFMPNRTINVEYPPEVVLNKPDDAAWSNSPDDLFNFTPISAFTSSIVFYCQMWTNDSGTWSVSKGSFSARNNTPYTFNHQLQDKSDISWGILCQEGANANVLNYSINRTINIDRTAPVVTLDTIANNPPVSYYNSDSLLINYTLTELNPTDVSLYLNGTLNVTDDGYSGKNNLTISGFDDGVYSILLNATDSASSAGVSTSYLFTIDTDIPSLTAFGNTSVSGSENDRFFNVSSDEEVNITIHYGTTTAMNSNQGNSTFQTIQNMTIDGFEENTVYYWNISACDRAGNCNQSSLVWNAFDFTFPWKLIAGWSYYGVYDAAINFSDILDQSESEFVYYWNQTNQEWISATSGGSTEMNFQVGTSVGGGRNVVVIYEETNSTWARNTTDPGFYTYNITVGDNYIRLPTDYTFGNLSLSFLNGSYNHNDHTSVNSGYNFGVELSQTPEGVEYNLTQFWYSAYNNTGVTWEPYYVYNQSAENNTLITVPGPQEVIWIHQDEDNLTWNGTNIVGNWTDIA